MNRKGPLAGVAGLCLLLFAPPYSRKTSRAIFRRSENGIYVYGIDDLAGRDPTSNCGIIITQEASLIEKAAQVRERRDYLLLNDLKKPSFSSSSITLSSINCSGFKSDLVPGNSRATKSHAVRIPSRFTRGGKENFPAISS